MAEKLEALWVAVPVNATRRVFKVFRSRAACRAWCNARTGYKPERASWGAT